MSNNDDGAQQVRPDFSGTDDQILAQVKALRARMEVHPELYGAYIAGLDAAEEQVLKKEQSKLQAQLYSLRCRHGARLIAIHQNIVNGANGALAIRSQGDLFHAYQQAKDAAAQMAIDDASALAEAAAAAPPAVSEVLISSPFPVPGRILTGLPGDMERYLQGESDDAGDDVPPPPPVPQDGGAESPPQGDGAAPRNDAVPPPQDYAGRRSAMVSSRKFHANAAKGIWPPPETFQFELDAVGKYRCPVKGRVRMYGSAKAMLTSFNATQCVHTFDTEEAVLAHMATTHKDVLRCTKAHCAFFGTEEPLALHLAIDHLNEITGMHNLVPCPDCKAKGDNARNLRGIPDAKYPDLFLTKSCLGKHIGNAHPDAPAPAPVPLVGPAAAAPAAAPRSSSLRAPPAKKRKVSVTPVGAGHMAAFIPDEQRQAPAPEAEDEA